MGIVGLMHSVAGGTKSNQVRGLILFGRNHMYGVLFNAYMVIIKTVSSSRTGLLMILVDLLFFPPYNETNLPSVIYINA